MNEIEPGHPHDLTLRDLLVAKLNGVSTSITMRIDGLECLINERDLRYHERDMANKEAVKAALNSAEKASEKTELALKEYKASANEWRDTVKDLVSRMITRPDVERELKVLENKISELRETRAGTEGKTTGKKSGATEIIVAINLIVSFLVGLSLIVRMIK